MNKPRVLVWLFWWIVGLLPHLLPAQKSRIDSLLHVISDSPSDTNKVNTLNLLSREYHRTGDYDKAFPPAAEALKLAEQLGYKRGQANSLHNQGLIYKAKSSYSEALSAYSRSLALRQEIEDKQGISFSYTTIGNIYSALGDYPKALDYQFKSLKVAEEIKDQKAMAFAANNLGNIFKGQNDFDQALKYYFQCVKIAEQIHDKQGLSSALNNIGGIYYGKEDYKQSLEYYTRGLGLFRETGNKQGIASALNNIAGIYDAQGDYSASLDYYQKSLDIRKEIGDKRGITGSYCNLAGTLIKQSKTREALEYAQKSLDLAQQIHSLEEIGKAEKIMTEIYTRMNDFSKALIHYKAFIAARDNLLNEENTKKSVRAEMNFDFEKKQGIQKADEEKQAALRAAENRRQSIILYAVSGALLLVLAFALFAVRSYRQKKKANEELDRKNQKIEGAYKIIEEKNGEITDSINYALRIQQAILPSMEDIRQSVPESFVVYRPKDIVSGDFYFFSPKIPLLYLAAVDCTGHGVPGAFMSMIASEKLNDAVKQHQVPGEILSSLNRGIKSSLHQNESEATSRDGMDIALCAFQTNSSASNGKTMNLHYAGANRPLWILRKGSETIEEIKATKCAIGGFTPEEQIFTTHTFGLEQGDQFYIFSDGYADQFGGSHGKKLSTKRFREFLISIRHKPMEEQKKELEDFSTTWKADIEQVDDILVISVRV